jgi:ankyrin repeat protein
MADFAEAIVGGDVERLTRLLDEQPWLATSWVDDAAGGSRSPLHLLADAPGHRPRAGDILRVLVAAGADLEAVALGMAHRERPLHWAASNDDVELVDALLDAGADIEAPGSSINGGSPLACAVGYGQWRAGLRLVERGALTQLWQAAALGLMPTVAHVVEGAPRPTPEDLSVALWNACRGGRLAIAQYLVQHGASTRWRAPWSGESALDVAGTSGNDELVRWLVSQGSSAQA